LQPGDVFVVWKLDRLSRSLRDLLFTLEKITEAGAGFRSLTEAVDTTTAAGRLMTQTLGAFAEFERAMIRERTMNGLHHARQAGGTLDVGRASPAPSVPISSPRPNPAKAPRRSPTCSACRDRPCSAYCANIGRDWRECSPCPARLDGGRRFDVRVFILPTRPLGRATLIS
jgi:hypothetical protein